MCFRIIKQCQKAKRDIIVKKRIGKNGFGWLFNLHIDGVKEPWKKGFHYTETDFPKYENDTIGKNSFHSFRFSAKGKMWEDVADYESDKTIQGIIPKGSYYYYNCKTKEYCSQEFIYDKDL